eukprot:3932743-Rhodomonas_salina.1
MKGGSYVPDESWVGTNSVFFGSNGGGNGWARKQKSKVQKQQRVMKAKTQVRMRASSDVQAECEEVSVCVRVDGNCGLMAIKRPARFLCRDAETEARVLRSRSSAPTTPTWLSTASRAPTSAGSYVCLVLSSSLT